LVKHGRVTVLVVAKFINIAKNTLQVVAKFTNIAKNTL